MSENIGWLQAAMSMYLTGRLAQFRAELEEGAGQPICALKTDVALLLSDLCRFLGLDEEQHNFVLGEGGVRHVTQVLDTRILVQMGLTPARDEPVETIEFVTLSFVETGCQ